MDDILRDVPAGFETARLTIRRPEPGDGAAHNAAVTESLADLRPWLAWAVAAPTIAESEATMRRAHASFLERRDLWFLLFLKGTTVLVGGSGLHNPNWSVPAFEIGYWVRSCYAGQGYITEAVRGIAGFARDTLGARRLQILCSTANLRSAAVARRAGFALEGTLRCVARHHLTGELFDEYIFAQVQPEEP